VDGLIGREREVAALEEALARVPAAVAIEGEPGIGKSRLLAEVARRANSAGARASEA
jgi:predicted ATPase